MFIKDDFLLHSSLAKLLFDEVKDLPIIDYHNHLSPKEIYENVPYKNITDLWLTFDHYKWRLMRHSGINEAYITGSQNSFSKFQAYASVLSTAYLNPIHHWSQLELKKYFNITDILTENNAEIIYHRANEFLSLNKIGPRELLIKSNVESLCTTDDLNDSLIYHKLIHEDPTMNIKVLPTFRPDSLFSAIGSSNFESFIVKLEQNTGIQIDSLYTLLDAVGKRIDFFQSLGCKIADHGLSKLSFVAVDTKTASEIFNKKLSKKDLSVFEVNQLLIYLLSSLITEYGKRNMVCQLHIGAIRDSRPDMYIKLGKDSGYDSISDTSYIDDLNQLLGHIATQNELPKMIFYNTNAKDNDALATTCANFTNSTPGKMQFGAAWWFNDHYNGIIRHLETYAVHLNLSEFVGMLTDSRSFLSFVRHEYYRRILCDFIATKAHSGHIPNDEKNLRKFVRKLSYENAKNYFGI